MTLREKIVREIRERGPIPFSRYMQRCLYDPEFGYYSRSAEKFGKAGDFYTASDVHAVFGRLLARQFEEIWKMLGAPEQIEILELGPGRGLFAQDVLDWSEKKFPDFFSAMHYSLLESSPALRRRIEAAVSRHLALGKASLLLSAATGKSAASVAPEAPFIERALASQVPIVIFANEFFDALPVEIIGSQGALRISSEGGRFIETWVTPSAEEFDFLDHYSVHPEAGERIEAALVAPRCMSQASEILEHGFLIIIDYGYTRAEQLAGRHRDTLMTYRKHTAGGDPYQAPGEHDITAHVNFTALCAAAEKQGAHVHPLITQSQFLLGIGEANQFADAFEDCRLPQERTKVAMQLKHLVSPEEMGESFRVLVASKGIEAEKFGRVSGLNFGNTRPTVA